MNDVFEKILTIIFQKIIYNMSDIYMIKCIINNIYYSKHVGIL